MKYIVILCDGMADEPLESLSGKTPLEAAKTLNMDRLAKNAEIGMVQTVPKGMSPGSDTANLSVIGYDPKKYYSGRSPLEALSIGAQMGDLDVSFRCNLVTLTEDEDCYEERTILDHSSGEISTELTPPHDILTKKIGGYLPEDEVLREMMVKSYDILKDHPINIKRREEGKNPANSAWFWGAGTRPALTSFEEKNKVKGAMISAVDLLKGIAVGAEMDNITVEGANGGLHTNYGGKAEAAVKALTEDGYDFVYVHIEAPDEMGHQGSTDDKIKAIELIDDLVIGPVAEGLEQAGEDYRMLILPDHPTPVRVRTHTGDPVPYMLYDSTNAVKGQDEYSERTAQKTGIFREKGDHMIDHLLERE